VKPKQFEEEARQAGCDYILSTEVVHRRGGGGAGVLGKALGNFEFLLRQPGATTPLLTKTAKGCAKSDGEDILTPLIEGAAHRSRRRFSKH
jgi:hypothetical protein